MYADYDRMQKRIVLSHLRHFHIGQTLECGQCFRFTKINENEYAIIAHERILNLVAHEETISLYPCTIEEFEEIWFDYFDLGKDYDEILEHLSDPVLRKAAAFAPGIRILNQDPWECLVSFIISQNKSIPGIQKVIQNIAGKYGRPLGDAYAFPTPHELRQATVKELRECKTGFRDRYILSAINMVLDGKISFNHLKLLKTEDAKKILMSIPGVGMKVSDCVLLYSLGRREVFPTDVWIKRAMQQFYFGGREVPLEDIQSLAKEKFGSCAGLAQQYLFHYIRQEHNLC